MPRRQWPVDVSLSARMAFTMFLLAALYLFFGYALLRAGAGMLTMAIFVGVMALVQYFMSDRLVLWSMGAREVSPTEAPQLHAMVERLAALADLPKPRVAIVDTVVPNAFATGRSPRHAAVAVTTGLLHRLTPPEVEAVLAHEVAHIRNRDVAVITLASFFATIASFIVQNAYWFAMPRGDRDRDRNNGAFVYLVSLVVWIISFFLIRALSRYREYAADRGAAILTGAPSRLASALLKISGVMERIPQEDLRHAEALNAFFIVPALRGESLFELFSTHPSLEKRLAYLKKLEQELER